jgi:copper resistance protein D
MALENALLTWIHLTSAAIWVGGSLFIGAVLAPILKTMSFSLEERLQIMIRVGRKFNKIAIPSLIILVSTGIYNSTSYFSNQELLLSTIYGNWLTIKIILVIAIIITYVIHVRIIRREIEEKIMSKQMNEKQIQRLRLKIIILGEVIVVLSIAVLFMAAVLNAGL